MIIDTVARVKEANPKAIYACDPVMGNAKSGCHVADEIPPMLRSKVVPVADIIFPNQFELGYLTERDVTDLDSTLAAVEAARDMGPETVVVTSVERPETAELDVMEMLVANSEGTWMVQTPRLPMKRNGSGDVTAALFTGHLLNSGDPADALAKTASSVYDMLRLTFEADSRELKLVESQEFFAHPAMQFGVEKL